MVPVALGTQKARPIAVVTGRTIARAGRSCGSQLRLFDQRARGMVATSRSKATRTEISNPSRSNSGLGPPVLGLSGAAGCVDVRAYGAVVGGVPTASAVRDDETEGFESLQPFCYRCGCCVEPVADLFDIC